MVRQLRSDLVEERTPALLVYSQEHPLHEVRNLLIRQGIETTRVRDCAQAELAINSRRPPVMVFTATDLSDGTWEDILASSSTACSPVPVVVVSNQDDPRISSKAWEAGVAGLLAPPFSDEELGRVVRSAMLNGFLASTTNCDLTEGSYSNAENHMGSGVLATQA